MQEQKQNIAHAVDGRPEHLSLEEEQKRKQQVLTQGTASITRSIADAVVMKNENVFFLTEPDGDVPMSGGHGYGLYYHDCRYLNGYELKLAGGEPTKLVSTAPHGFTGIFELTNPEIQVSDGEHIAKNDIGITWRRTLEGDAPALHDLIAFQNYGLETIEVPVSLIFRAEFESVFAIRGLFPERLGRRHSPSWEEDDLLHFLYDGADGLYRSLSICFSPGPTAKDGATAHFRIKLEPREQKQLLVSLFIAEAPDRSDIRPKHHQQPDLKRIEVLRERASEEWLGHFPEIRSDSLLLNHLIERSFRDLLMLRSHLADQTYFAAGLPWFGTLFGRDSLITALQTLAYDPVIAEQTLRVLANYQGDEVNEWRDEQPGKILHEMRVGELARIGEIPHHPYYGTVDATPLFLVLVGRHAAWTGDLTLFHDLRNNIERALEWMAKYGDANGDGYIEYQSTSEKGLINQGWKDSGDAIVNDDGSLATPPISLVEVQGYAYLAKMTMADLFERTGEPDRARQLREEAQSLRERFNRDFWLEEKGIYALALQAGLKPCAVVSSNPGHALWAGIADRDKGHRTVERLMADDMNSGWGIRTLSSTEARYNPVGYHLGTVWPHDNAIIVAGFRCYGHDDAALRIATDLMRAAMHFDLDQLPELFAGFKREEYGVPVRYPVACHPQAWAAGSVPFLLETLLGLAPDAFNQQLRIERPMLPDFVDHVEIRGLKVGRASADLRFGRTGDGSVTANVLEIDGDLDVVVEPEVAPLVSTAERSYQK